MNWLLIFFGGGLGSIGRFAITLALRNLIGDFPVATLCSNVVAAIFIGVLYFIGAKNAHPMMWSFFAIGVCGGLSTFSAFSLETFQLFKSGQFLFAWANVLLSLVICILSIWVVSKFLPE